MRGSQFTVVELAAPLDGLLYIPGGGDFTEGAVSVGCADVTGGAEDFTHVFGEVEAIGVPGAVLLDGQRTGGDGDMLLSIASVLRNRLGSDAGIAVIHGRADYLGELADGVIGLD